jgi:beta-glucosidase
LAYASSANKFLPTLEEYFTTPNGEPGWLCKFYAHDENGNPTILVDQIVLEDTRVKLNDFLPKGLTEEWTLHCTGLFNPFYSGEFEFGLTVAGRAKLFLNQKLVIDNWTHQRPGEWFVSSTFFVSSNESTDCY